MPAPWRTLPVHGGDVERQQRVERPRGAPSLKPTGNVLCSKRSVMAGHLSRSKEVVLFLFGSRGSRSPCATTAQGCSRETDAQAAQETRLRTRLDGDRQTALLWRGKGRNRIVWARHEQGLRKYNRAENSHRPTRLSERTA